MTPNFNITFYTRIRSFEILTNVSIISKRHLFESTDKFISCNLGLFFMISLSEMYTNFQIRYSCLIYIPFASATYKKKWLRIYRICLIFFFK